MSRIIMHYGSKGQGRCTDRLAYRCCMRDEKRHYRVCWIRSDEHALLQLEVNAIVSPFSKIRRRTRDFKSLEAMVNKLEGSDPPAAPTR